jgi:DNA helicase-2/ATP-dependent DNA helicase PcrA
MEPWQVCELEWKSFQVASGNAVTLLAAAIGNTARTQAPLTTLKNGEQVRTPDIVATNHQETRYWEVKYRSRPDFNHETGEHEYWMEDSVFFDYLRLSFEAEVSVALYQDTLGGKPGYWMTLDIATIRTSGRRRTKYAKDGALLSAWCWPAAKMEKSTAPSIHSLAGVERIIPNEGFSNDEISDEDLVVASNTKPDADVDSNIVKNTRIRELLQEDNALALDVFSKQFGLPGRPNYSVTVVSNDNQKIREGLAFLSFGIRYFVVSNLELGSRLDGSEYADFREARLLEFASIDNPIEDSFFLIDGSIPEKDQLHLANIFALADESENFNSQQYFAVHEQTDSDVMVRAGAGTGKTETITERLIYLLLSTSAGSNFGVSLDSLALVTFTNEAAAELASRITRTLTLRHRLCKKIAYPAGTWLMQSNRLYIGTIHKLAEKLSQSASQVGLQTNLRVKNDSRAFRACVEMALSQTFSSFSSQIAVSRKHHEWVAHIETLWNELEKFNFDLSNLEIISRLLPHSDEMDEAVTFTSATISKLGEIWKRNQEDSATISVNQLVPFALRVTSLLPINAHAALTHIFVDEFQDTDAEQIRLLSELRKRDVRVYAVGDEKQGIYKFRGAAGEAFNEASETWQAAELRPFRVVYLNKNFRTGKKLIDSLEPYFRSWNQQGLLSFPDEAALKPGNSAMESNPAHFVRTTSWKSSITGIVREKVLSGKVGILFATNAEAKECQSILLRDGVPCAILVGGSFFQSPAIREVSLLLNALENPYDHSSNAQLMETKWIHAICSSHAPKNIGFSDWDHPGQITLLAWQARFKRDANSNTQEFELSDIRLVSSRVRQLSDMLRERGALVGLLNLIQTIKPWLYFDSTNLDNQTEMARYESGLDQLLAIVDETFASSALSIGSLAEWLRAMVATDHQVDEDFQQIAASEARVIALTVWKSKGLEYDHVLVPNTTYPLALSTSQNGWKKATNVLVKFDDRNELRSYWVWSANSGSGELTNYPGKSHAEIWRDDDRASIKEQTRVLYVAFTRAKHTLTVLLPNSYSAGNGGMPTNWAGIIAASGMTL